VIGCQNNDKDENVDLRKEHLIRALQEHPEQFWGPAATTAATATVSSSSGGATVDAYSSQLIFQETSSKVPRPAIAKAAGTESWIPDQHKTIWTAIRDLVVMEQRTHMCASQNNVDYDDSMEIDDEQEKNAQRSTRSDMDRVREFFERFASSDDKSHDELPNKVARTTAKDLLQIIQSMADAIGGQGTSIQTGSQVHASGEGYSFLSSNGSDGKNGAAFLLCEEEFSVDSADDDTNGTVKGLVDETNFLDQLGNGNPKLSRLLCHEEGFFEGDDESNCGVGAGDTSKGNQKEESITAQKIAILQETTRLIRAKTLELTKLRLQGQC
jgi:hypothetical protein